MYCSAPALAEPITYGDKMGADVWYRNISEDANTAGDEPPLFGEPDVNGNSLNFDPVGFSASSENGGTDQTDGQLNFMVEPKDKGSYAINNIKIKELGDTGLVRSNDNEAFTEANLFVHAEIVEIDGESIDPISVDRTGVFSPMDGSYRLSVIGGTDFDTAWMGSAYLDLVASPEYQAYLDGLDMLPQVGITKVNIALDNRLKALSQEGTSAVIAKKDQLIITTNIPEPASSMLAITGILATLLNLGRRRG